MRKSVHCYKFFKQIETHSQARNICKREGGQLLEVPTSEANFQIADYLAEKGVGAELFTWMGLKKVSNKYQWVESEKRATYFKWNSSRTKGGCVALVMNKKDKIFRTWQELNCNMKLTFSCMKRKG